MWSNTNLAYSEYCCKHIEQRPAEMLQRRLIACEGAPCQCVALFAQPKHERAHQHARAAHLPQEINPPICDAP